MSYPRAPHSTTASSIARTPPLSPNITPSSSQQSLSSSSESSTLSTPFENLSIKDPDVTRPAEEKNAACFEQGHPYAGQLEQTDESMFEMLTRESPRSTPCGTPSHRSRPSLHHSHSYFPTRTPGSPTLERERPALLHRNTSYSRRHASLDSPREVPLPSMHSLPHQHNDHQHRSQEDLGDFYCEHMGKGTSGLSGEQISEPRQSESHAMDTAEDSTLSSSRVSPTSSTQHYSRRIPSGNVPLQGGRPISAQDAARPIYSPTPVRAGMSVDRNSTLSLPVPMHMPYHTLPSIFQQGSSSSSQGETSSSSASASASAVTPSFSQRSPSFSSSSRRPAYMAREDTLPRYDSSGIPFTFTKPPSPSTRGFSPLVMADDTSYVPAPVPPTILTPPPPPAQDGQHHAPHEPFLARSSPRSTEIRVETSRRDYKLIVRLPGYRRDSITLSARRRRILHIVADSWEPGGGHLERRVSFGYDADLAQVRAEFDGEYLRVTVPRRITPMTYMEAQLS